VRGKLLSLRELIFQTAAGTKGVGVLEETLKWGEPAYLTTQSKSGSTIRLGWKAAKPKQYTMYFHCQTNLIDTFKQLFPEDFTFEGNRAIVFEAQDTPPKDALRFCVNAALTYHLHKRTRP
jgi:Domain of unknown function (DU1801)